MNGDSGSKPHANGHVNGHAPAGGFDAWTVADIFAQRWHWMVIGGIVGFGALLALAPMVVKPKFTAHTQLQRYEPQTEYAFLRSSDMTTETFSSLIRSPDLLRRVGEQADPPIPPERFAKIFKIEPQPDSDFIKVSLAARNPTQAVELVNLYSEEVVRFTKQMQATQAMHTALNYLQKQLEEMDNQLRPLYEEYRLGAKPDPEKPEAPRPTVITARLSENLQKAIGELSELQLKFKDAHPAVQEKQEQIEQLQTQIAQSLTNNTFAETLQIANMNGSDRMIADRDLIRIKLFPLEDNRIRLAQQLNEARLYSENPPGFVRLFAPATLKTVESNHRRLKIGILAIFGGGLGMFCALGLIVIVEFFDSRLKTADDVKRVTKLPVLTTLGDLKEMQNGAREQWAFRTWTLLQGRLSRSQNHGLVCGITSSTEGEGRSTWISLLSEAASLSGFRVLTIATRPSPTPDSGVDELTEETLEKHSAMNTSAEDAEEDSMEHAPEPPMEYNSESHNGDVQSHEVASVENSVLSRPSQVTDQLTGPNSRPVVHIPLPGWVWNLDRRKQWRDALSHWRQIDNLVIFVELPPASVPEAVLLGSNLPNLVWLTDSGTAKASDTRVQIETLRNARCNLVGAVLNREQATPLKQRFPRWLGCLGLLAALSVGDVNAQEPGSPEWSSEPIQVAAVATDTPAAPPAAETPVRRTNYTFSAVNSGERAEWQQRLTLGPGDVLNFNLYGEPLLTRAEVTIAPDGRVSYLEAQDIVATGLTIDELRQKIDETLGQVRRAPRVMITPVAYKSKKYFMLGKVVQRGVYTLDRPITVIEALARAHGLETGLVDNNTLDLADLERSFLMRDGKRIELNFEKLFLEGDLSQNIQIEPNDYLYFPSANLKEVYVLGEVALPGPVTFRPDATVLTAISTRGGFNERAYRARVLVVRGSLHQPETFAVNTSAVLDGKAPAFRLEPKDIVYVSHRPWYRIEDLLDTATTAFIQALVTGWVGVDVMPPQ